MNKEELIEYAIRTSNSIKDERKQELIDYFYRQKEVIDKLRNEIKVHSKKSNERYKAIKNQEKYIDKLQLEAQKYFDMMMEEKNGK